MYIYRFFLNFESAKHLSNFLLLWNVNRKVKHFIIKEKVEPTGRQSHINLGRKMLQNFQKIWELETILASHCQKT